MPQWAAYMLDYKKLKVAISQLETARSTLQPQGGAPERHHHAHPLGHAHAHALTHAQAHTHTHTHTHTDVSAHARAHAYLRAHSRTGCAHVHAFALAFAYTCASECIRGREYTRTHTRAFTDTHVHCARTPTRMHVRWNEENARACALWPAFRCRLLHDDADRFTPN
eukprot:535385-Pleurochrysis_carterae.AAC.2